MNKVEQGLHARFANLQSLQSHPPQTFVVPSQAPATVEDDATPSTSVLQTPFAKINSVAEGSPAEQAGLRVGDKIYGFGGVDWTNHQNLEKVSEAVRRNAGVRTFSRYPFIHSF